MAYSTTARNACVDATAALGVYISMHTADPGTSGASEVTGGSYARASTTWAGSSSGSKSGSQVALNIPISTTITHWGLWSASTSGTFVCGGLLSAPSTYSSAGIYNFTPTLTATSG